MTLSVFTYAVFTGLCGLAGSAGQIGILRFVAALGMGGEWSLGVALVMEVWPNRSRAFMAGLIGAAANIGILLVGLLGLVLVVLLEQLRTGMNWAGVPQEMIELLLRNKGWRLMMILGTVPALLTVLIRMFVPESEKWEKSRDEGSTRDMASTDLVGVLVCLAGPALILWLWAWPVGEPGTPPLTIRIGGTIAGLAIASAGYSYPMLQSLRRRGSPASGRQPVRVTVRHMFVGACLSTVAILGSWGTTTWSVPWADKLTGSMGQAKEITQSVLACGAIVGTIAGALIGGWLGRRWAFFLFCVASVLSVGWLFLGNNSFGTGSWSRYSWPGSARRRFTAGSLSIFRSCFKPVCEPQGRGSPSTLDGCWPRPPSCRRGTLWPCFSGAMCWWPG